MDDNGCKWWGDKKDLGDEETMFHEPRKTHRSKMTVETVFREYVVPFHLWQHERSFVESALKNEFFDDAEMPAKSIRSGDRMGENNSDILITVSGYKPTFTYVSGKA